MRMNRTLKENVILNLKPLAKTLLNYVIYKRRILIRTPTTQKGGLISSDTVSHVLSFYVQCEWVSAKFSFEGSKGLGSKTRFRGPVA